MKYEKPDLEEMELELEGSFLQSKSPTTESGNKDDNEYDGPYD